MFADALVCMFSLAASGLAGAPPDTGVAPVCFACSWFLVMTLGLLLALGDPSSGIEVAVSFAIPGLGACVRSACGLPDFQWDLW